MSNEAKQLHQRIVSDNKLVDRIAKAKDTAGQMDIVMGLARAWNLEVKPDMVESYLAGVSNRELTDGELEQVVGGKDLPFDVPWNVQGTGSNESGNFSTLEGDDGLAIDGGGGNDWIVGTKNADLVYGNDGDDTLYGYKGDDTIIGGTGDDYMVGGQGGDDTDSGDDYMHGGDGNDSMWGESGNDTMGGGSGNDWMVGGEGNDWMQGDSGNDTLLGGDGDDTMIGGSGDDYLVGGDGNDLMGGGDGDDYLHGEMGDDELYGGAGNDTLGGGGGDDTIDGGSGDDVIGGASGDDLITGGSGADTFVYNTESGNDTITDFNAGDGDNLYLHEVSSMDDFQVSYDGQNTVVTYGDSTITLEGVELTKEQIWEMQQQEDGEG